MTYREAKYCNYRMLGDSGPEAARKAGFGPGVALNWRERLETPELTVEIARLKQELVTNTLEVGLIDAKEIHEYLSEALRADMRDIRNDDGSFRPQSEWPEIWGRMMEAGDVEIEYLSERSHDGETKDQPGGWDRVGAVKKVKLKFSSKVKLLELAMKHKGVDAMIARGPGADEIAANVMSEIDKRISEGRQRAARRLTE